MHFLPIISEQSFHFTEEAWNMKLDCGLEARRQIQYDGKALI